jgi:hypothetical protein
MSADPPRYSQRHFNWEEPVAPDGSIPLDYLLGWLKTNLTSFRQAADRDEALMPLCQELNRRGSKCTVANIVVELECLTKTAWRSRKWITPAMYDEDLFESYFDGKDPDLVRRHRDSHISGYKPIQALQRGEQVPKRAKSHTLRWMNASPSGGLSPMAILVSWFPDHIKAYTKADKSGRLTLLKDFCDDMRSAGHAECSESKIAHKIYQIRQEVEQELDGNYDGSACFVHYRDFFMELFGYEKDSASANEELRPRWRRRHRKSRNQREARDSEIENVISVPPEDNGFEGHGVEAVEANESAHGCDSEVKVEAGGVGSVAQTATNASDEQITTRPPRSRTLLTAVVTCQALKSWKCALKSLWPGRNCK